MPLNKETKPNQATHLKEGKHKPALLHLTIDLVSHPIYKGEVVGTHLPRIWIKLEYYTMKGFFKNILAKLGVGPVEYTSCISALGLKLLQKVSWIWHNLIVWGSSNAGALGNVEYPPSLPWEPGPLWPGVVAPDRVPSMGQIEQFDI